MGQGSRWWSVIGYYHVGDWQLSTFSSLLRPSRYRGHFFPLCFVFFIIFSFCEEKDRIVEMKRELENPKTVYSLNAIASVLRDESVVLYTTGIIKTWFFCKKGKEDALPTTLLSPTNSCLLAKMKNLSPAFRVRYIKTSSFASLVRSRSASDQVQVRFSVCFVSRK